MHTTRPKRVPTAKERQLFNMLVKFNQLDLELYEYGLIVAANKTSRAMQWLESAVLPLVRGSEKALQAVDGLKVGDRVEVTDASDAHYGQAGTVAACSSGGDYLLEFASTDQALVPFR